MLGSLPKAVADGLLAEARKANAHLPIPRPQAQREEEVAMVETLRRLSAPPENLFAPFTLPPCNQTGKPQRVGKPRVHWAHVDSGAQVCVVHKGVVDTFPELRAYHREFTHSVQGVGNAVVPIVGKLVQVPVSVGGDQW